MIEFDRVNRRQVESMSLADASIHAAQVLRDMGRKTWTDRELSILAREYRRIYHAGRWSMLRTIAQALGMTVIGDGA